VIYLLDTDTIVYWLNGNRVIAQKATVAGQTNVALSTVSQAELYYGAYNSIRVEQNVTAIQRLTQTIALLPFDEAAAQRFGQIKARLKQQGQIILDADVMIASIALAHDLTLVTNNTKHFSRIPDLALENWTEASA